MSAAVIKCENVYKIFGANAQKMLKEANGNVDAKTFQENGCIVGVNDASFEVSKGEMLVVMGLSVFLTLLASIFPAWKASKISPAEALRYE